jgi:hypothetical protein
MDPEALKAGLAGQVEYLARAYPPDAPDPRPILAAVRDAWEPTQQPGDELARHALAVAERALERRSTQEPDAHS